jgi:hypothetical protein
MSIKYPNIDQAISKSSFDLTLVEIKEMPYCEKKTFNIKIDSNYAQLITLFQNKLKTHNQSQNVSFKIFLKWNVNKVRTNLSKISEVKIDQTESNDVNLSDCLKLFTQPERLTSDNPWYCSRCKKHQEALKQMSLWRLPKYLLISLKRFQASKCDSNPFANMNEETAKSMMNSRFSYLFQNRVVYNKLDTLIKYPLKGLDMSKYLVNNNEDSYLSYDLCGIVNHLGRSISLGHYTAFSRTHDKLSTEKSEIGWRLFDDQFVHEIENENQVVTKDAYVLLYRLRTENVVQTEQISSITERKTNMSSGSFASSSSLSSLSQTENRTNEWCYDAESDESVQLNDDEERNDFNIDFSDNETREYTKNSTEFLLEKFTNLDETD